VRLYDSLACVGAIEDFIGAIRERRQPLCSIDEPGGPCRLLAGVESFAPTAGRGHHPRGMTPRVVHAVDGFSCAAKPLSTPS